MKRVLLTGATGFIGSHCIAPLIERGYEVNAVTSREPGEGFPGVRWHRCNLLDVDATAALLRTVRPSHLLHLAWYVVPGKLISAPENYDWFHASFGLVRKFCAEGGAKVVSSGSSYEYDWKYGYCSELTTPRNPDTVYGVCKNALYEVLKAMAESFSVKFSWGRVFFLYGPREHPNRLVSSIIRALLRGEPAKTSHGRQIRDYLHVQDVADGLVALLDSDVVGPVNIGSGIPVALREIIQTIGRMLAREDLVQIGAVPARANDAPLVVADVRRLTEELQWRQRMDIVSGLEQTIDWWKRHTD